MTIPVKVYSATEEKDISFRQVHEADGGRIRYKRVCEIDGEEVPYSDIGKGYEMPDGRMVILTNDDFARLPLPTAKSIEVLEFVPVEQVDPLYFAKAYYLACRRRSGAKPYVLLRDALTKTGAVRAGQGRDPHPGDAGPAARARRRPGAADHAVAGRGARLRVRRARRLRRGPKQEVGMAESYISTLKAEFDPERYHSDYREALEQLVEAKAEGLPMPEAEEEEGETAEVVDLVAALRASVDAAKKRRAAAGATARAKTAKKATAKKTAKKAAKKAPAKKSTAKKSDARRRQARRRQASGPRRSRPSTTLGGRRGSMDVARISEPTRALQPYAPRLAIEWLAETPEVRHLAVDGTLAFLDISGFTKLTERLARAGRSGPEELSDILDSTFGALLGSARDDGAGPGQVGRRRRAAVVPGR